jgi:hypothetical protein
MVLLRWAAAAAFLMLRRAVCVWRREAMVSSRVSVCRETMQLGTGQAKFPACSPSEEISGPRWLERPRLDIFFSIFKGCKETGL